MDRSDRAVGHHQAVLGREGECQRVADAAGGAAGDQNDLLVVRIHWIWEMGRSDWTRVNIVCAQYTMCMFIYRQTEQFDMNGSCRDCLGMWGRLYPERSKHF